MNILSIGGSDTSSGAGIQSDIKIFSNNGFYPFTVITAITSQNTKKITSIEPVSMRSLESQMESVLSDFQIDAIKIGMVFNSQNIKTIHSKLKNSKFPIVVDPIIKSTTGRLLLKKNALSDYRKMIIPLADVITPNRYEAKVLTGLTDVRKAAKKMQIMDAKNVIITGFTESNNKISDFILEPNNQYKISGKKIPIINHGSGCDYSASMVQSLAKGLTISKSVRIAKKFVYQSIKNSISIGKGINITHQELSKDTKNLHESINEFTQIKNIHKVIPECQTNFVFSKNKPKTVKNVLGISGRLVKSGNNVVQAGELVFGGSQHVATAVIEVSKKFSNIRSAINIKYEPKIITNAKKHKMLVLSYNRKNESKSSKLKENSSISWGISSCLKSDTPDIIYHKGDFGKEPMIIVFGATPTEVVKKIKMIK